MSTWLQDLPQIESLWQEVTTLDSSLKEITVPFAQAEGTVLLLSGSNQDSARYEILGLMPRFSIRGQGRQQTLSFPDPLGQSPRRQTRRINEDPFDCLNQILNRFQLPADITDLPVGAGLFGYFSYDLKDSIEDLPVTGLDTGLPEMLLYLPSLVLIQDRQSRTTTLAIPLAKGEGTAHVQAVKDAFFSRLETPGKYAGSGEFSMDSRGFESSYTKSEYLVAVEKIIDYRRAGDIYKANLSQRFETGFSGDPYALFLSLFDRNPAPFFSYIQARDHAIVSTSPERFIQLKGDRVETRPIKGTLARGKTPAEDKKNGEILSASKKDDAELTMIVDLMRNDLSRVTEHGSVVVTEHKRLEPYDNVFHLVSVVEGRMQPGKTGADLIRATFPGGSITGCPKIRAMEIIDELEPHKRHIYTGSIGYLSFHNTMDLSIAIRTATILDDRVFFSVGGGIVYDSDPEAEFQETLDKGKTLMETLAAGSSAKDTFHPRAWINGKMVDQDRAVVSATGPGFQYGSGLFETLRVDQGRIQNLDAHVKRMADAWAQLYGTSAPDITWETVISQLIRANGLQDKVAAVKLIACPPAPGERFPTLAAFARPYVHRLESLGKSGLDLVTFPDPRQTPLAGLKTLNYLYYDRAGAFARSKDGDEALILNPDETVSETNTANLLIREGQNILLPQSCHALPGTTLAAVTQGLVDQGFILEPCKMSRSEFLGHSNILAINSLMGAVRVNHIDGHPIDHDSEFCDRVNGLLSWRE